MIAGNHVPDLLPAYALGALDEVEALQVAEHLKTCPDCAAELAEYQRVVEALPLAVSEQSPDPRVRQRLLERAAGVRQPTPVRPHTWPERLAQIFRKPAALGLAFSLVMIAALLISNLVLWSRLAKYEANRDFRTVALAGTAGVPEASGLLVIGEDGNLGTLVVDHLPVLDSDRQYQLWLIKDGQRTSGGVFSTDDSGYGALAISAPDPLNSYDAVGITVEPFGGSPGPTGEKVMGGDL